MSRRGVFRAALLGSASPGDDRIATDRRCKDLIPILAVPELPLQDWSVSTSPTSRKLAAPEAYSPPGLWTKLRRIATSVGETTLLTILTLFYCLQDADTPRWARGVIIGALGYLILPLDVIPDLLPGMGYGDDWAALVAALGTVAAYIKDEHKTRARGQLSRLFGTAKPHPPGEFSE